MPVLRINALRFISVRNTGQQENARSAAGVMIIAHFALFPSTPSSWSLNSLSSSFRAGYRSGRSRSRTRILRVGPPCYLSESLNSPSSPLRISLTSSSDIASGLSCPPELSGFSGSSGPSNLYADLLNLYCSYCYLNKLSSQHRRLSWIRPAPFSPPPLKIQACTSFPPSSSSTIAYYLNYVQF